jgi:hypothetical protein
LTEGSRRDIASKRPSSAARSASIRLLIPGYCTLTATRRPSARRARCTWAMEAEATGSGSNSSKASPRGRPISRATAPSMTVHGCGGTRSWSSERLSMYGAGRRSGRVEANWAALIKVPPKALAASSTRPAPRRCCSSQSSSRTKPGAHRARSLSAAYPDHSSVATTPSTEERGDRADATSSAKLGSVSPPAETALPRRSPAASPAAVHKNAWAQARSPKRVRNVASRSPSASSKTSFVSSPERQAARASTSSAARLSSHQTSAASARRRLAANTADPASSQPRDRFFAASAYSRAISSGFISNSFRSTHRSATARYSTTRCRRSSWAG